MKLALIVAATGLVPVAVTAATQANGLALLVTIAWVALSVHLINRKAR